jgi:hypothetical protein
MTEQVYIYTSDKYGADPYLTTLQQLQDDLDWLAENEKWEQVELTERVWTTDRAPVLVDQDNEIVAEAATLEGLAVHKVAAEGELFWRVVARQGWGLIEGLLGKREGVTFGRLRVELGRYKEIAREEVKMHIKVEFSTDSLFGYTDEEEYDVKASVASFQKNVVNALYDKYPDAEIEVANTSHDRVIIDGMTDHDECPWVDNLIHKVWESWEWLEGKGKD